MVGELIAKFPRHSGDLFSLKKFTQTAKVCTVSLGRSVLGASYYVHTIESTRTNSLLDQRHTTVQIPSSPSIPGVCRSRLGRGLHRQYFPSRWRIVIFSDANPHLTLILIFVMQDSNMSVVHIKVTHT